MIEEFKFLEHRETAKKGMVEIINSAFDDDEIISIVLDLIGEVQGQEQASFGAIDKGENFASFLTGSPHDVANLLVNFLNNSSEGCERVFLEGMTYYISQKNPEIAQIGDLLARMVSDSKDEDE